MRILFHAPGLVAHRPAAALPFLLGVQPPVTDSLAALMENHRLTGNRGNLIHAEAPARIFSRSVAHSAYGNIAMLQQKLGERYANTIAGQFDIIVISMANFIRPDHDGGRLAEALVALKERVPFVVLGAGLQGTHRLEDMMPGNRRLIEVFNERAAVFGLRGEKTAEWLSSNGFHNGKVLGCPSLYAYPQSILAINGTEARARGGEADVMTAGHLVIRNNRVVPRGRELIAAFRNVRASYVFQDEFFTYGDLANMPGLYCDGNATIIAEPVNQWLSKRTGEGVSFERYYYFNEAGAWRQAACRHDVFIGDRFHGGVAALQAAKPAIFLKYDNRVSELTAHFGLPALTTEEFREIGLKATIERYLAPAKLAEFKQLWAQRYSEFITAMAPVGLTPSLDLAALGPMAPTQVPVPISTANSAVSPRISRPETEETNITQLPNYMLRTSIPTGANELVISFEAADTTIDRRNIQRNGFGENFLVDLGYGVVSVLTHHTNWFRPTDLHQHFKSPAFQNFLSRFDKIHSYGSSMGGFGALAFADLLKVNNVVVFQPISSLAVDLVPWETRFQHGRALNWSGAFRDGCAGIKNPTSIYGVFDPSSEDRSHAERISLAAKGRFIPVHVLGANHAVPRYLQRKNLLKKVSLACLQQRPVAEIMTSISKIHVATHD